jgi:predicted TPR repeat methyltransferase
MPDNAIDLDQGLQDAMRLHQAGDVHAALAIYESLLAHAPEHATLRNFLGMAQIQLRRFAEGEDNVRRALAADPSYAEAWNSLGNLYRLAGRPEEALAAYLQMTRLAPGAVTGWVNLADLYRQMGHRERAQAALASAVRCAEALTDATPAFRSRLLQGLAALHGAWAQWLEAARLHALSLELVPDDANSRRERVRALLQGGRRDEALQEAQAWLQREPGSETARRVLQSASEDHTPVRAADDDVRSLFDSHAASFEAQLAGLGYRAPALIQSVVASRLGPAKGKLVVCDAGCGTGLCGPWLRPYAQRLDGVDLSQGMLDLARERRLYDGLACAELTGWLLAQTQRLDLIVAADVLCYFGDLAPPLHAARAALQAGGLMAFSVEHAGDAGRLGYRLQLNGRYAHAEPYVRGCLQTAGFVDILIAQADLRLEGGEPVVGLVVTAQRPGGP